MLGTGAAPNFSSLLVARAVVGVGEAAFIALAAPMIGEFRGWRGGDHVLEAVW